jgi:23S rRNA-/tRNA-specific pseudouridylate synthase
VLDKPTGLPVYPTSSHYRNTVLTLLHHHRPELAPSLFLCHRLDRDTSGVLLAAKGAERFRFFTRQFFERTVEKRYLAVVARAPARESFEVDAPVGGRRARTRFLSLGRTAHGSCLAAFPEHGRRHQIRIHLAEAGLPILGDRVHGGAVFARFFLHAESLSFDHPTCGRVSVSSPVPAEFERIANPQSL